MKKLIAMIGAVATAFGLYAGSATNITFQTSFEEADIREGVLSGFEGITDLTLANTNQYAAGEAYAYDESVAAGNVRRPEFDDPNNYNYLKLETGTNVLTRALAVGDVFADQVVKFTGFEEPQTNIAGKVAVWMTAIEQEGTPAVPAVGDPEIDNGEGQMIPNPGYVPAVDASADYIAADTNIYITAGLVDADGNAKQVAFKIDQTGFKPEQWYRVTIQNVGNIFGDQAMAARCGFAVYIDGVPVTSEAAKTACASALIEHSMTDDAKALMAEGKLFPAIEAGDTLATVGYQGIGAIDDVTLDNLGPEFARTIDFTLVPPADAEVTLVKDSKGRTLTANEAGIYTAQAGVTLTVTVTAKSGFFFVKDGVKQTSLTFDNLPPEAVITLDCECIEAAVQVVNVADETVTNLYAEAELNVELIGLKTGDTATVLKNCAITQGEEEEEETLYSFAKNTTIEVPEANVWNVHIAKYESEGVEGAGMLIDNVGLSAGKTVNVTFDEKIDDDNICALSIYGAIAGDITADDNGIVYVNADGNEGCTLSGTITAANVVVGGLTLGENGKLITTDGKIESILDGEGNQVEAVEGPEAGWYTYALKQATGFAIIIAGGTTKYFDTLQDAINAAGVGDYAGYNMVTILEDCELDARVTISGKTVTLAAGETPVTVSCATDRVLEIVNNSNVTIGENVTLTSVKNPTVRILGSPYQKQAGDGTKSTLVVNGTIANTNPAFDATFALCGNGDDYDGVDITIGANGVVSNANGAAIYFPNPGTLTVNGTVEGYSAIIIKDGELVVNNGAVITATGANYQVFPRNTNGATPTGDAIIAGYYGEVLDYGTPEVTINGGTITVNTACTGAVGVQGYDSDERVAPDDALSNIEVAGGTFNAPVAEGYCADGFIPLDNGDGTYGVKEGVYVARVNGQQGYETLAEAVAAAQDDDTITLLADTTDAVVFAQAGAFTLDLNDFALTMKSGEQAAVKVDNAGADVTIKGGTITIPQGAGFCVWARQGDVIIVDGTFTNDDNDDYCVYAGGGTAPDFLASTVTILGGTFNNLSVEQYKWNPARMKLNLNTQNDNETAVISVQGGTFSADPAQGDDSGTPASFVAEGYASVKNGDSFEVGQAIIATFKVGDDIVKAETNIAAFTATPPADPSVEGKTFTGWQPDVFAIAETTEFVAQFADQTFNITFTDAAEWTNVAKTVYNEMPVIPTDIPTVTGKSFKGWDAEVVAAVADATYTAVYTANVYKITYTWTVEGEADPITALDNTLPTEFTFGETAPEIKAELITLGDTYESATFAPATVDTSVAADLAVTITLTKAAQVTPVDPEDPQPFSGDGAKDKADAAAAAINADKGNLIKTPDGATATTYTELFTAVVKPTADGYEVVVELNEKGTNDLQTAANDAETEVGKALSNFVAAEAGTEVKVELKASEQVKIQDGFFYGIAVATELSGMASTEPTEWAQAKNGSVELKATKPTSGNAAFFQIKAKVK